MATAPIAAIYRAESRRAESDRAESDFLNHPNRIANGASTIASAKFWGFAITSRVAHSDHRAICQGSPSGFAHIARLSANSSRKKIADAGSE